MEWGLRIRNDAKTVAEVLGIPMEEAKLLEESLVTRISGNVVDDLLEILTLSSNDPVKTSFLFYLYGKIKTALERCDIKWNHKKEMLFEAMGLKVDDAREVGEYIEEMGNRTFAKKSEVIEALVKKFGDDCAKLLFAVYAYGKQSCEPMALLILPPG